MIKKGDVVHHKVAGYGGSAMMEVVDVFPQMGNALCVWDNPEVGQENDVYAIRDLRVVDFAETSS